MYCRRVVNGVVGAGYGTREIMVDGIFVSLRRKKEKAHGQWKRLVIKRVVSFVVFSI